MKQGEKIWKKSKLLLVDDDTKLLEALRSTFETEVDELRCRTSVASTLALLDDWQPDILVLDLTLDDGDAFAILDAVRRRSPTPAIVAISGTATPALSFRLAQAGVQEYLSKPFTMAELRRAIERAMAEPRDLRLHLRRLVGLRKLSDVQEEVRTTLVNEALARTSGSRRAAARLLGISRQLLQYILRTRRS